jgi:hypothetical protein
MLESFGDAQQVFLSGFLVVLVVQTCDLSIFELFFKTVQLLYLDRIWQNFELGTNL